MVTTLNFDKKVFVIYIAYLNIKILIQLAQKAQIALLIIEKIVILVKYLDYTKVFSKKSVIELFN